MLKATNIVAFIFLFELIIMSTEEAIDHYIWPIIEFPVRLLLMRILVVGMLSPIHHWVEETMLHYLKKRGMLQPEKRNWRKWFSHFFQKHQTPPANQELHEEPATASTTLNDKSDPAEAPVS